MRRDDALPATMRAHILVKPGEIDLREVPRPTAGPGEIVVRVRSALTCGTDIKAFVRGHPKFPMPTPFGHEFSGQVVEAGAGAKFHEGDAVMAAPTAPCGRCYHCERQQENLCDTVMDTMVLGAYADFIKLPQRIVSVNVYRKPDSISFATAALMEPLACVLHGLDLIRVRADDTVVLIGAGPISLLHLLALRNMGVGRIVVVVRTERRAAAAQRLGADEVLIAEVGTVLDEIRARTAGRGADIVIECTGQVEVWEAAPALARSGGQVVLFGGCRPGTQVRFDTQRLHYDQLQIISPFHFTPRAVRRAHELLAGGKLGAEALISGTFPLPELRTALTLHQRGEGVKFAVEP
jgi:L-iditol 2-dehydrogenase